ncbi:MAG: hypothetical protein AAGI17_00770 [Planctomycetota bacterium]
MTDRNTRRSGNDDRSNLGGILEGLSSLLGSLGDLAEKGEQLEHLKNLQDSKGRDVTVRSSFKFGTLEDRAKQAGHGGGPTTPEPFRKTGPTKVGRADVSEAREPEVEIFDEGDGILLIAEMPGIAEEHIAVEIEGDILTLTATSETKRYHAEIVLPREPEGDETPIAIAGRNGVFEIQIDG